jgi:glycosyltransferase involved in cell wall biosynthesis
MPLVSVLIPAFNAGRTIERALASVFAQDREEFELIVVDDGSTDDTAERAARYEGVRLLRLRRNRGVSAASNAGVALAKGEFIAFLDADDEWLPGKLEAQIAVLEASPTTSFVCGPWREVRLSGSTTVQPSRGQAHLYSETAWRELLAASFVLKSTVMARKACILNAGGFDEKLLIAEDQDMWIRLALLGTVGWYPEPLTIHYETPNSLTKRYGLREQDFVLPMIERHLRTQRANLTARETNFIRGTRYARIGRSLYQKRQYAMGLNYLLRAILRGIQPAEHLAFILIASPPARWIRHRLRCGRSCRLRPHDSAFEDNE